MVVAGGLTRGRFQGGWPLRSRRSTDARSVVGRSAERTTAAAVMDTTAARITNQRRGSLRVFSSEFSLPVKGVDQHCAPSVTDRGVDVGLVPSWPGPDAVRHEDRIGGRVLVDCEMNPCPLRLDSRTRIPTGPSAAQARSTHPGSRIGPLRIAGWNDRSPDTAPFTAPRTRQIGEADRGRNTIAQRPHSHAPSWRAHPPIVQPPRRIPAADPGGPLSSRSAPEHPQLVVDHHATPPSSSARCMPRWEACSLAGALATCGGTRRTHPCSEVCTGPLGDLATLVLECI